MKTFAKFFFWLLLGSALMAAPTGLYKLQALDITQETVPLSRYQGKVALVVNVASQCGFTGQYAGLEKLYQEFSPQGLVVLGFPSNDFGGQEPGQAKEIQEFCSSKFHVTFPMFDKVTVKAGPSQSPVYQFLSSSGQSPSWNFGKYLVNRQGKVVGFFGSTVAPESPKLRQAVQQALAQP